MVAVQRFNRSNFLDSTVLENTSKANGAMRERLRAAGRSIGNLAVAVLYVCYCCCSDLSDLGCRSRVRKLADYPNVPEPPLRPLPATRPGTPSSGPNLQAQCLLLTRLPVEIRLLIWELVLGRRYDDDCLHLDARDGILWYRQCWETNLLVLDHDRGPTRHVCWDSRLWSQYEGLEDREFRYPEPKTGRRLLNLSLSCKLMWVLSFPRGERASRECR